MAAVAKIFSVLALAGFFLSLVAHLPEYTGIEHPHGIDPWPLYVSIFIVWLPAVLASTRLSNDFSQTKTC